MLKNALKMLYLIAHFQKISQGENPPCKEVWGKKSSWKMGVGKDIKLVTTLYNPATKIQRVSISKSDLLFVQLLYLSGADKDCAMQHPLMSKKRLKLWNGGKLQCSINYESSSASARTRLCRCLYTYLYCNLPLMYKRKINTLEINNPARDIGPLVYIYRVFL